MGDATAALVHRATPARSSSKVHEAVFGDTHAVLQPWQRRVFASATATATSSSSSRTTHSGTGVPHEVAEI
jgi:hypothetical protein